jgi:hypothetical protein
MKTMKKMLFGVSMAALIASPALAQTTRQHSSAANHRAVQEEQWLAGQPMQNAYAPDVVIEGGKIVGQDPDPNVRLELRRDSISEY